MEELTDEEAKILSFIERGYLVITPKNSKAVEYLEFYEFYKVFPSGEIFCFYRLTDLGHKALDSYKEKTVGI